MTEATETTLSGAEGITWNLSDLYLNLEDPQIEKDFKDAFSKAKSFEEKYRGKINSETITPTFLLKAVKELESISEQTGKLISYAYLMFATDTSNPKHGAFLQSIQEKTTEIRKHLMFFELEWIALPDEIANHLLEDEALSRYSHFLQTERRYKPHKLNEPEEKILDEKANTGSRAFMRLFDEVINNIRFKVKLDGRIKHLSEAETLALLYDTDRNKRKAGAIGLTKGLKENAHVLTYIFNILVQDHTSNDRLRSFTDPMASRHLDNEIDKPTVDALMTSCEKNFDMVEKYYNLKKRLLGLKKFHDYDRYSPIFPERKTIGYKESKKIVLEAFGLLSPRMAEIAKEFFDNSWIDAELRSGKRGGAFSHSTVPSVHPYVFLNYTGRLRDVMTLAHELGHGIHQYLSRKQGYFQCHTPLTTAETASVFGEMLVFHTLKESEKDPKTRLSLLCSKLEDIFATVFRQVVLTRFEEKLHHARRNEGELTSSRINELWIEANKPMFGDSVELTKDYAWWWMYIPHFIHSPFYCYAYSFGELLVIALYQKYQNERNLFVPRYIELLSSGGSDAPEKLLARVGVDITDPNFWQGGLDLLREMVNEAVALVDELRN
ncbi:MAG: oligoendopeptidase [Candidatus Dadabacteria bacterium CSP1-2]|nr:MAG: oligoendopeptidase [Candidatus Dadabacteria bacterium CSP1-2]